MTFDAMAGRSRLVLGALAAPPAAAEAYRPDPALVAAAKKEGQVLIYTTLIVDQIVRPLIQAFQAQVPASTSNSCAPTASALVVRLTNEAQRQPGPGRHLAARRRRRPAGRGRHRRAARPAERQGAAGGLCRSQPALGHDQPRGALARLQHQARSAGTGAAQLRRPASSRASRASSPGTRTPFPAPTASSAPCSGTWARRKAWPICARSRSRTSRRCRWRSAPCSTG